MEIKGEALKIYSCEFDDQQRADINSIFNKEKMKTVTDYYSAFWINKNLEENRYSESGFRPMLKEAIENDYLKNFNADTFKYGNSNGVTLETIRLVELLYNHIDAGDKIAAAVKTLLKLASATSGDDASENQIFFIAPKSASELDLT